MDFMKVSVKSTRNGVEIYPKFIIKKSSDMMIRGGDFYAIWLPDKNRWSTNEEDALRLIDQELSAFAEDYKSKTGVDAHIMYMWDSDSGMIDKWHKYCQKQMRDNFVMLDEKIVFANDEAKKEDYASKRLDYSLENGSYANYDKLISTLYSPEERHKIEWCIGSIVTGDSKTLQKFMVLYGEMGSGKSTIINIIQQLFKGYYSVFDAKALGSASNSFALEAFRDNPLIAIQHDGDLSRIEDNTRLNSLVSHELMTVNEKFKSTYANHFKCFLIMGTNKPVKITDSRSGLIRRLIDVSPTGDRLPKDEYDELTNGIKFELGAIAYRCMQVYLADPNYYNDYMPYRMLGASNDFYNFMEESYFRFKESDGVSADSAWAMYYEYCTDAKVAYPFSRRVFKEELKNYFRDYYDIYEMEDGTVVKSYYTGFRYEKFFGGEKQKNKIKNTKKLIEFKEQESIFDTFCKECPAQYANEDERPTQKWDNVTTK